MDTTIDLNQVALFVRVVETESFTRAAEALGLPKSSVSRAVSRLEEHLGVRLLQRTTRRLNLTDAGRAYFEEAQRALSGLADAASAAVDAGKEPRGVVRVTAPVDIGVILLTDIVARFVAKYPLIHIELHLSSNIVDLVAEGIDLAVRPGRLSDSNLVARRVGCADLGLFAAPEYLARKGTPKKLDELAAHDCVLFRGRDGRAQWKLEGPSGERKVEVRGPLSVDDMLSVRQAVEAGIGIGLLPTFVANVDEHSCRGTPLTRVLSDFALRGGALNVVTASSRYQPARVVLFREFLLEQLNSCSRVESSASRGKKAKERMPTVLHG